MAADRATMIRALLLLVAVGGVASCTPRPAGTVGGLRGGPGSASGELGPADLGALGTRVHTLNAEPAELRLRVGQRFSIGGLRVEALDFRARRLGRLRVFDRRVSRSGVATLPGPGEMVAVAEGIDTLYVSFPATLWRGEPQARPQAAVVVYVVE